MKKQCLFLLFIFLLLFMGFLYAEEEKGYPPEGMEIIKIGDTKYLMPKGTKLRKKGDMHIFEDISEYSSRKFTQIEKQFEDIETKHNNLANETKENFKQLQTKQEEIGKTLIQIQKNVQEIKDAIDKKNNGTN